MSGPAAKAAAHNPTVRTEPRELGELRHRVEAVIELCVDRMSVRPNPAGLTDADTIWPSQVLDILRVDYGPGSDLARRPYDPE